MNQGSNRVGNSVGSYRFGAAIALIFAAAAILQFVTAKRETQTYDESHQLLSGYTYLTSGRFTVGLEHPPLVKVLWAIPVWFLHPDPPPANINVANPLSAGQDFLYRNRVPADTMLNAARGAAIAISVLLGVVLAQWTRRHYGAWAGLTVALLYALDPNILANGRYLKNDIAAALAIFAFVMIWGDYLLRPSRGRFLLSALALGVALATKSSSLVLIPVAALLYAIRGWQQHRALEIGAAIRRFAVMGAIAFVVIWATFGFEVRPLGESGVFQRFVPGESALSHVPIPTLGYIRGLGDMGLKQAEIGLFTAYVLGEPSQFSRWYLSPVALGVKTPIAELALFGLAAWMSYTRLRRTRIREIDFKWFLLSIPPLVYLAVGMWTHFNAGTRHLLPLYPFLYAWAAAVLLSPSARRWGRIAVAGCLALLAVETASIHPHYLAFFNVLAGGPSEGSRFLVDSNLDWGQDVKYLKEYLDAHEISEVALDYFGMADVDYYGVRHTKLAAIPDSASLQRLDCVVAVSVTNLRLHPDRYAGLDGIRPDARVGYSIYVYDRRKARPPLAPL